MRLLQLNEYYSYCEIIKICTNEYLMVVVQNKYKNILVGVLRTQITFVTHSPRLISGNLGPQKTDLGVFIIMVMYLLYRICFNHDSSDKQVFISCNETNLSFCVTYRRLHVQIKRHSTSTIRALLKAVVPW